MKAFQKRAEAAAWQSRLDEAYAKRVERQMALEDQMDKIQAGSKVPGYSHTTQGAMNTLTAAEHGFTPRQVREKPVKRSNRQSPMTLF